jgi:hypothetical protein
VAQKIIKIESKTLKIINNYLNFSLNFFDSLIYSKDSDPKPFRIYVSGLRNPWIPPEPDPQHGQNYSGLSDMNTPEDPLPKGSTDSGSTSGFFSTSAGSAFTSNNKNVKIKVEEGFSIHEKIKDLES